MKHARYYWLLLAESHLTRRLFESMVRRIELLPLPAGRPTSDWADFSREHGREREGCRKDRSKAGQFHPLGRLMRTKTGLFSPPSGCGPAVGCIWGAKVVPLAGLKPIVEIPAEGGFEMPDLSTPLHLNMWRAYRQRNSVRKRISRAVREILLSRDIYGLEWGDPEVVEPLRFIRDRHVLPYVSPERAAVEIGPGGGRWTRYLLGFKTLYVVDYHPELLAELKRSFNRPNMKFVRNNGCDFPGIEEGSVDFIFSFGCFVHLEASLIKAYLKNIGTILKRGGNAVIQYSDKSKIMAQLNAEFSDNTPERMRQMVSESGLQILEEDLTTMWHSSLIRFAP
jgi:SAM-dependent methyltransferase